MVSVPLTHGAWLTAMVFSALNAAFLAVRISAEERALGPPLRRSVRGSLAADLQVDSVGAFVLAVALEDRFRVKLTGTDASSVISVEDLVGVVERAVYADRSAGEPQGGEGRQRRSGHEEWRPATASLSSSRRRRGSWTLSLGCSSPGAVPVPLYPPVRLGRLAEYHVATARMIAAF